MRRTSYLHENGEGLETEDFSLLSHRVCVSVCQPLKVCLCICLCMYVETAKSVCVCVHRLQRGALIRRLIVCRDSGRVGGRQTGAINLLQYVTR